MTGGKATIAVEGITLQGLHGVFEEERKVGNVFIIDIYIEIDIEVAAASDQLADALDYSAVYRLVEASMNPPANLLEHLVGRIGRKIATDFPQAEAVKVRVSKVRPLYMPHCERTYVEATFVKGS